MKTSNFLPHLQIDVGFFVPLQAMTEYTITGIRFQMAGESLEEKTKTAESFVAKLKKGQLVILMAEPENPFDTNAIAAYIDYERVGYINKEETADVYPLLDEQHQCDAQVERTDGHVTFFISIPGAPDTQRPKIVRPRILPPSPLGPSVYMPFTKAESALQLISSRMESMEITKDNMEEALRLADRYSRFVKTSICYEDNIWRNRICKKLDKLRSESQELGLTKDEAKELTNIYNKIRDAVGDLHRTIEHWPEQIFVSHLDVLRRDDSINQFLYAKYCKAFLGEKVFTEADQDSLKSEYYRLTGWFKDMAWSEMKNPRNLEAMGLKVNYLGLSRQELYELYSVLLLIERIEPFLPDNNADAVIDKLKPIFYNDRSEAQLFYKEIMGMKPKQITDRVNQLVRTRKISEMSRKRELWMVLHDYGLYEKSESNWNSQVD